MFMRVLAPRRPPLAPVPGTAFSLTAHAVLLVAATGAPGTPLGTAARAAAAPAAETIRWVGLGDGSGGAAPAPRRPGARYPIAYVIPGRHGLRDAAARNGAGVPAHPDAGRARERRERTDPRPGSGGGAGGALAAAPDASRPRARPAPRALAPALLLPAALLPDAEAARLVAGVLASAPDAARRDARPEEFAPPPGTPLLADMLVRTGTVATASPRATLRLGEVPVPLVDNPVPAYPVALLRAGQGGRVLVEFVVDSTGSVDAQSLRVLQSSDGRLTDAVRHVLPRLHFVPAQRGEQRVSATVRQPFLFTVRAGR